MIEQGYLDKARRAVAAAVVTAPTCAKSDVSDKSPLAAGGPPDDPVSSSRRAELLWWGQPLGLPSLVEVNLGAGAQCWTTWLELASPSDLQAAVEAARARGPMGHGDPRCRLANWAIDARYPQVTLEDGRTVGPGYEAWEVWVEFADDESIDIALRAMPWPTSYGETRKGTNDSPG